MTLAYPLEWPQGWPRSQNRRYGSPFKVTFGQAVKDLYDELELLKASTVVISSWLPLRLDGSPRGDQARYQLPDPGVAVYFTLRGRPMVLARDAYSTCLDNLRSIGLAIAHLRGLERHGGAQMMERAFTGFEALPSPSSVECFRVLGLDANASAGAVEAAFRKLAQTAHPDRGGSHERMAQLTAARTQALRTLREAPAQ